MRRITFIVGLALGLMGGSAYGQSCYSEQYGTQQVYESPAFDIEIPGEQITVQTQPRRIRLRPEIIPQSQPVRILPQVRSTPMTVVPQVQFCPGGVCVPATTFGIDIRSGFDFGGGFAGVQSYGYGGGFREREGVSMERLGRFERISGRGAMIIRRNLRGQIKGIFSY